MVHFVEQETAVVMRSDAARNRARIVEAARAQFAANGPDAGMEAIASAAGLAVGTLYRHYPTKADLVAAIVGGSLEQIADLAEAAAGAAARGNDAADELGGLFRAVAGRHAADRVVKAAAASLGLVTSLDPAAHPPGSPARRAAAALTDLLGAAQRVGSVRGDVTFGDLAVLLAGVPGLEVDAAARGRYVDIVLSGLRAHR